MIVPVIRGVACTRFGRQEGIGPIELMNAATDEALTDAALEREAIDGLLCGYATTFPHLMLSDLFAERAALRPVFAQSVQLGGATGAAMLMQAADLVRSGRCQHVLVVAGENRLSGQSTDRSMQALSQVGDEAFEVRNGVSVPAFYALLASRFLHETGLDERTLAALAVTMRQHAARHPGAHMTNPLSIDDVLASRPIATPLKLLDCCPISDGGAALIVSRASGGGGEIAVRGAGQAHRQQHLTALRDVHDTGARVAAERALAEARMTIADLDYFAIYDSFTITIAMLLDELGLVPAAEQRSVAQAYGFSATGDWPLNLHGGLLSFGHSGVAGGMAHAVEAVRQLRGEAGARQAANDPGTALLHGDGGVMSAHVSLVLERVA